MNSLRRLWMCLLLPLALLCAVLPAHAQRSHGVSANDTILVSELIIGNDTFAHIYLPPYLVDEQMPKATARRLEKKRNQDATLRYNVYKVYPYAVAAAEVLKDVDVNLDRFTNNSDRKAYLKKVEAELDKRFKGELKDMSINQGEILIKLIDRQTGKNCFSIVKELKGGFNAFVWQSVALIFSHNLKREYEPYGRDQDIESVVQELETKNYYEYQAQQSRYHK